VIAAFAGPAERVVDEIRGPGHLVALEAHTVQSWGWQLRPDLPADGLEPADRERASFVARSRTGAFSAVTTLARSAS